MRCSTCGNEAPDGSSHCPSCGNTLTVAPDPWSSGSGTSQGDQPAGWSETPSAPPAWGGQPPPAGAPSAPPAWGAGPSAPADPPAWGSQAGSSGPAWNQPGPATPPNYPPSTASGYGAGGYGGGGYGAGYAPSASWGSGAQTGTLAGWWYRVGATVIDVVILFVAYIILRVIGGNALGFFGDIVVACIYFGVLLSRQGASVGMMALGTKCVREADGAYLQIWPAIGRYLLFLVLYLTAVGGILDVLWPLWDAKNQTIHDKAVGSLVVRTR